MHPVALEVTLGGRHLVVPSYGVCLALATLVGGVVAVRASVRAGIDAGRALAALGFVALGAGLGGVAFQLFVDSLGSATISAGTLGARAVVGSLLGGLVALVAAHFVIRVPFPRFADATVVAVPIAQAIGRIGCFLGGCCYGAWTHFGSHELRHPWPLYESAADLVIAAVLSLGLRHTRPGVRTAAFFALYAAVRIPLELLRGDDSDRGMFFHGQISASQLACAAILVTALAVIGALSRAPTLPAAPPAR